MIKIKSNKKAIIISCFLLICLNLFAQTQTDTETNSLSEENLQTENIDKSLQKNFVILENIANHTLNPHITSLSSDSQILTGLYEGLFSYDPISLEPCFAIAKEYKISRDKKRWTFTLRDDAFFSNGEKITANDVKKSWIKLLATPTAPYASLLYVIQGAKEFSESKISSDEVKITVNSENSFSIVLNKPASYLPRLLCHSAFSVVNEDLSISSGAFYLASDNKNEIILKKNKFYWDERNTNLEQITFIQSDDPNESSHLFNNGDVDWICGSVNTTILLNPSTFVVSGEFGTAYLFFKIHEDSKNNWLNRDFRNALMEAVPWDDLRDGYMIKADTFVYPLQNYPSVNGFSYTDEQAAIQMMDEARKKYNVPKTKILDLTLDISENGYSDEKLNLLKNAWQKLGVNLIVNRVNPYEYFAKAHTSSADMLSYVWIGDYADPLAFLELFRSDSSLNDSGWKNKEFDDLLDEASLASAENRYSILAKAENILLDDAMVLPMYHPIAINIIDLDCVGGWASNPFDLHPLKYIFKKEVKTKIQNVVKK